MARLGKEWHKLLSSWIESRLEILRSAKDSASANDMIVATSRYRDPETGQGLSDGEFTAEMTTLLIAGSGTVTTGLTSLLWCLSRWPGSYRKAVQEVRTIFETPQSIAMNSLLTKCTYLRACLYEAMRVSPAPTVPLYREAGTGGAVICGVHIPAGYEVATTIYALHHNEDKEKVQETKVAWAPFSIGERNCVGMTLATIEILITMATILWHGDFRITDDPALASIGASSAHLGTG
jgi:cytochrome P450